MGGQLLRGQNRPLEVKIEVTARCNLDCAFCYNRNSFGRETPDPSLPRLLHAIDAIANAGVRTIRFTGGEPMLRKDIRILASHAKQRGLSVILNTNRTLLDAETVRALTGAVDHFFLPFHDIRESDAVTKTCRMLYERNASFCLNTVTTTDNIARLEDFFDAVAAMNAQWVLVRPVPTEKNPDPMTANDAKELIERLITLTEQHFLVAVDGLPFCSYDPLKVRRFSTGASSCGIHTKLVLDPSGRLKPCYSVAIDIGGIEDIERAWGNSIATDFRHYKLLPSVCRECLYLEDCKGGCRWAAKLATGSYDGLDPLAQPDVFL